MYGEDWEADEDYRSGAGAGEGACETVDLTEYCFEHYKFFCAERHLDNVFG